jgi:hypothetical protein
LFEEMMVKYSEGLQYFAASNGWFWAVKKYTAAHTVKVSGEAASWDIEAAKNFPEWTVHHFFN